jgi:hypothetical protein
MSSCKPSRMIAGLLLILAMLITGLAVATYSLIPQNKSPEASSLPNSTSSAISKISQRITQQGISSPSSSHSTAAPGQPHYFLQSGRTLNGNLASVSSNNLFYHGGPTMHVSVSYAIFWLPNGNSFEQSSGTNSAYVSLIDRFLNDTTGTSYYNILNQYPDKVNGAPLDKSILGGSYLDTTPYPSTGTSSDPLHDSDIQAEVVRAMAANNWSAGPDKMFHVFTGYGIESCFDASSRECTFTVYCAYHNFFTQGARSIIYSNMPDFNGVSGRCTPRNQSSPNNDYYADPEINILSHELFEAITDPLLNAWQDSFLAEIGDKCAWIFGTTSPDGSNLVVNGHKYLVQLEWSNYENNCALSYGPAHSLSIAPSPGSATFPSTIRFNITYSSQGSNWWSTTAYANGSLTLRVDQSTQIVISNQTSTIRQTEKWCFDQSCSGASFTSGDGVATTYYYYDLLAQTVSVSPVASVPSAPLVFATGSILPNTLGLPRQLTVEVNQTPQTIWALRGAAVSVASPTNAGTNTRWVTRISTWIISYASQIPNPIVYYPQYLTTFRYTVTGGGFYSSPTVTYYDTGLAKNALAGTPVWVDSASTYAYQSQLPGSTQYERWSPSNPSGQISAPGSSVSANYYHEYNVTASFHITDGMPSSSPYLTGETLGLNIPTSLSEQPSTIWLDAGSIYTLTSGLPGSSPLERWEAAGQTSGIVGGAMTLSPTYLHQYFLTITGALPGSTGQGWYDSGSSALATTPGVYGGFSDTRSRLISYSVDNGPSTILNGIDPVSVPMTMNLPHMIRFSSITQYSLTSVLPTGSIISMTPSSTGDSWYDEGTSVSIVLNRSWDLVGSTRQSLVSYSVDNVATPIDRTSSGPIYLPKITMTTGHVLSEQSNTQYFISVQSATVSYSQTGDGWFDSGSNFTVEGTYSQTYSTDLAYHVYAVPVGFQILSNSTADSVGWISSSDTLSFNAARADVAVYIPAALRLVPTGVLDNGVSIVFSYSDSSHILRFAGSSQFQVRFSSTVSSSSPLPLISDWVLYPAAIAIVVAMILVLGLFLIKRQPRKTAN